MLSQERGYQVSRAEYNFFNQQEIHELNRELLDHDYPTDIITLDSSRARRLRVEIFIGVPVVKENALDLGIDFSLELARVMVHGLLHCMGWDDTNEDLKAQMRAEEDKCLISRPK